MNDKLSEICARKRDEVTALKKERSAAELDRAARAASAPRGFAAALARKSADGQNALICEIKKASPSAGLIRPDFDPTALAQAYERGGAACLSVLTDEKYFQGRPDYLIAARAACSLPVLRKDFMLDTAQVAQARAMGADCVLLICSALEDTQMHELHAAAIDYGMDVLIEVHDEAELDRALALPSGLIGINNRNLKTLATDLGTSERLAPLVPKGRDIVGESGISKADDLRRLNACGIERFLIGEALMRQEDVEEAVKKLRDC